MMSQKLPSVLIPPGKLSAISMERALNQIKSILDDSFLYAEIEDNDAYRDKINASIDDVEVMLMCIERGDGPDEKV